jgi:hypothetical protein
MERGCAGVHADQIAAYPIVLHEIHTLGAAARLVSKRTAMTVDYQPITIARFS